MYNGILLGHKKEQIWVSCSEVDEPRASYTKWSKSEREKQVSYIHAYMWNLEKNSREWTCGHSCGSWGWDELRKYHWHIHTVICKTDSGKLLNNTGSPACDDLEGWDVVEGVREVQEGGDIGIPMADLCQYMAETNTIL